MGLVIGLDGGGSKTHLAVCDRAGHVTGFHAASGFAPNLSDEWIAPFEALLAREAGAVAGCEAAVFGLPFHGEDAAHSASQIAVVERLLGARGLVQNDVRIAFDGAFAGGPGALILAGTGSMAWASLSRPGDAQVRVGGWGHAIGDEGSAFWIGLEALNLVSRALDGRAEADRFRDTVLAAIGADPETFNAWVYGVENERKSFAAVAMIVATLAEAGDAFAQDILTRAADHLALQVTTAWRLAGGQAPLEWSYAGGVFRSEFVLKRLQERLRSAPRAPKLPPIGGALLRAAQNAGWTVDDEWISTLAASLTEQLNIQPNKG